MPWTIQGDGGPRELGGRSDLGWQEILHLPPVRQLLCALFDMYVYLRTTLSDIYIYIYIPTKYLCVDLHIYIRVYISVRVYVCKCTGVCCLLSVLVSFSSSSSYSSYSSFSSSSPSSVWEGFRAGSAGGGFCQQELLERREHSAAS